MGKSLLNRSVMFGTKATTTVAEGDVEVNGINFDLLKMQALIFPENNLEQFGFNATLKGLEKIDDKLNYVVVIGTPSGDTVTDYFDVETGLRTKMVAMVDGPNGKVRQETKFMEYFEMDGIKYVRKMKQSLGAQSFDVNIESIDINTNLSDDLFQ